MVRKNQNFLLLLLLREDFQKNLVHFSICACHPCAGAMLIFSVSFQFYRMIPEGNPVWCEKIRTSCCFFCFAEDFQKNLVHFSICACHPCAGAMLIFSVSFQFYRMIPEGNPVWCEKIRTSCCFFCFAKTSKKTWYTSRFVRVILAQGPC